MNSKSTQILFMFGPGGVGKTTLSSALGLSFAATGLDVLVITVDPARRLKDVLRLKDIGFEPVCINDYFREESGEVLLGKMDAMMVDSKDAFLNLLKRYIPEESVISKIVANRIFKFLSESMIGAQEYFAAEKIYDIFLKKEYDIIIVDTAPSKNAFEFIDGAHKMVDFLDKRVIRFFADIEDSGSLTGIFFKKTGDFLYKILGVIFGLEFISDMKEFLNSLSSMYDNLLNRAYELSALYLSENVKYFIIGSPQKISLGELSHLMKGLRQRGISKITTIINRAPYFYGREELMEELNILMTNCKNSDIRLNLEFILALEKEMLESIKRDIKGLDETFKGEKVILPDLYSDIYSLGQLLHLGDILRGGFRI
ncbi:MAG: ArsA family ATPase [Myxococcota bacterium]